MKLSQFGLWLVGVEIPFLAGVYLLCMNDPTTSGDMSARPWLYMLAGAAPAVLTFVAYPVANASLKKEPQFFLQFYFSSLGLKSVGAILFIFSIVLWAQPHRIAFAAIFFAAYLGLSAFEVRVLLSNLRHQKKTAPPEASN